MRKYAPYCAGTNPALSKRSPVTYWGEFRNGWRGALLARTGSGGGASPAAPVSEAAGRTPRRGDVIRFAGPCACAERLDSASRLEGAIVRQGDVIVESRGSRGTP